MEDKEKAGKAESTEAAAVDQAVGDPADKKAIRAALKDGTTVWCLNNKFVHNATPCAEFGCPFKADEVRVGKVAELAECGQYEITTIAEGYEAATPLFPYSR